MTVGKVASLLVSFVGALVVGMVIGAHLPDTFGTHTTESTATTAPQPAPLSEPAATVKPAAPPARRTAAALTTQIPADAPELQKRLRRVLNAGTNMDKAADGFRDAEQFATVAHAAKNTDVPFMVLKHRVLNEGMPLSTAIHESNPYLDVSAAAQLARAEARKDIAALDE